MSRARTLRRASTLVALLFACLVVPSTSQARELPVRMYSSFGSVLLEPAYLETTDGGSTAVLRGALSLNPGYRYLIRSCLQVHVYGAAPVARCENREIDTQAQTTTMSYAGPTVSLPNPATLSSASAWASGRFDLFYAAAGAWQPGASTLPDGVGVPQSIDLRPGTAGNDIATPQQGVDIGSGTGGVDTAGMNSLCVSNALGATTPLPTGVTANPFGSGAPAYSELGQPTSPKPAKGVVLVLHGGGWATIGQGSVETVRPEADRWRKRGWLTVNASYRGCGDAPTDARWFADQVRLRYPSLPFCIVGASAGAHLALLTASRMSSAVDCVVGEGAPIALAKLASQSAYGGASGTRAGYNVAVAAFGEENLAAFSPSPTAVRTHVLLATAAQDTLIPYQQATDFRSAVLATYPTADIQTVQLAGGTLPWVHASVSQAALIDLTTREDKLATAAIGSHR